MIRSIIAALVVSLSLLSAQPTITSITPSSGAIGATVTIAGTNFSTTPANNVVYFGGVKGSVQTATAKQITVKVPLGAQFSTLSVTTGGYSAYSKEWFAPTFSSNNTVTSTTFLNGPATFTQVDISSDTRKNAVSVDVDGDGKLDIVTGGSNAVGILLNTHTTGAFVSESFSAKQNITLSISPLSLAAEDIDGDGKKDIIVTASNAIVVLRNTSTPGSVSFSATTLTPNMSTTYTSNAGIGDVDGDGRPDIVFAGTDNTAFQRRLLTYRNTSSAGSISFSSSTMVDTNTTAVTRIIVADLDGDGKGDVALAKAGSTLPTQNIEIFRSTSTAGSVSYSPVLMLVTASNYSRYVSAVDMNGDGKPELISGVESGTGNNTVSVFTNTSTSGTISFGTRVDKTCGGVEMKYAIGDVTGDGLPDIVTGGTQDPNYYVIKNTSSGGTISFGTTVSYQYVMNAIYWGFTGLTVGDANLDGKPDIIGTNGSNIVLLDNMITSPQFRLSSSTYSLGTVPIGMVKRDSIQVSNNGGQSLTISSVTSSNATDFTVSPTSAVIASGSSQWFAVTYQYNSAATRTTNLVFTHTAASVSDTVNVTAVSAFSAQSTAVNALQFDGVNDMAEISDATDPSTYTVEMWVKFASVSAQSLFLRTSSAGPASVLTQQIRLTSAGKFEHLAQAGSTTVVTGTTVVTAGQWYHVAATATNNGMMRLFVNGLEEGTAQSISTLSTAGDRYQIGAASPSFGAFNGTMDEVRLWNTQRTASQIQSSFASLSGNESGLSRYYRSDEGAGTVLGDGTGNAVSGSLQNGASFVASTAPVGLPVLTLSRSSITMPYIANGSSRNDTLTMVNTGKGALVVVPSSNNARLTFSPSTVSIPSGSSAVLTMTFSPVLGSDTSGTISLASNAAGSPATVSVRHRSAASFFKATGPGNGVVQNNYDTRYAAAPASASLNITTFTTELWVKLQDVNSSFIAGHSGASSGIHFASYTFGWILYYRIAGSWQMVVGGTPVAGQWTHLAAVVSGSSVKFYVNGTLVGSGTGPVFYGDTPVFSVGMNPSNYQSFSGELDEVRIWNVARTPSQIISDLSSSLYGNETGLEAYWRFDEGSGTTTQDMTLNGHDMVFGSSNQALQWQVPSTAPFPFGFYHNVRSSLSFGNVQIGRTARDSFYVFNGGDGALTVSSIGSDNAAYTVTPTSATIAVQDSAKFAVTFAPTAVQNEVGTLTVNHNGFSSPAVVSVNGDGADAVFSSSVNALAFGTVHVGEVRTDTIIISNNGAIPLVIDSVRTSNTDYTVSPSTAAIAANGNAVFIVSFSATAPAAVSNGTLTFYHSATGSPASITVSASKVFQPAASAGNALSFTGTSKFVDVPATSALATANYSAEAWVKIGSVWTASGIIDKGRNNGSNWYITTTNSATQSRGVLVGMQGGTEFGYAWGDTNWHHVAVTFDGSTQQLYVDGVSRGSSAVSGYTPTAALLRIGGRQDTSSQSLAPFTGSIDEIRLWNTARTQAQIQASYASVSGNESGLAAYFRADESSGATLYDLTGNGRNGTLVNAPARITSTAPVGTPVFSISRTSIAYGNIYFTNTEQETLVVRNSGSGVLNISSVVSDQGSVTVTPSTFALLPADSVAVIVAATPVSLGSLNGTVTVTHNASASPFAVPFTSTAVIPTITSFSPANGPVGTVVTITGTGFESSVSGNIVSFGAQNAVVTSATATQITAVVPVYGQDGTIRVRCANLTAESRKPFVTTFSTSNLLNASALRLSQTLDLAGASTEENAVADVDGDGKNDVVAFCQSKFSVFRNTSVSDSITFAARTDIVSTSLDTRGAVADVDGDGRPDVVVAAYSSGYQVRIFRNTSGGPGSVSFASPVLFTVPDLIYDIAVADMDGDGKLDIILTRPNTNKVTIYRNTSSGPGTISFAAGVDQGTAAYPLGLALVDLNGDGLKDIVVAANTNGRVSVIPNQSTLGTLSFGSRTDLVNSNNSNPYAIRAADINGDGKMDIVSMGLGVDVFTNTGAGAGGFTFFKWNVVAFQNYRYGDVADITGDGRPDIIPASNSSSTATVYRNTSASGSVSFDSPVTLTPGTSGKGITVGDLNNDGKPEIMLEGESGSARYITVYKNAILGPPVSSLSASLRSFGSRALGSSTTDSVVVRNTGAAPLVISTIISSSPRYTVSPTSGSVAAGDSMKLFVTFLPTQVGTVTASVVLTHNAGAGKDTLSVTGTGTGNPFSLDRSGLSFGTLLVSQSKAESVMVRNNGLSPLTVSSIASLSAQFSVSPSSLTVPVLDSAKVFITYLPSVSGAIASGIRFVHSGSAAAETLSVTGYGTHPVFSANKSSIAFDTVHAFDSRTDTIVVSNPGQDTLVISSIAVGTAMFSIPSGPDTLAPGSSVMFPVLFSPGHRGILSDTAVFVHNAGAAVRIALHGISIASSAAGPGRALDLAGGGPYLSIPSDTSFKAQNFTIETWVNIRSLRVWSRIMDFGNGPADNNIIITASDDNTQKIGFHIFDGGYSQSIQTPDVVPLNTWIHVACVLNGNTGTIYINGAPVASGDMVLPVPVVRYNNYIGKSNWADDDADLQMDEFRIWDHARTEQQIRQGMYRSLTGAESGLVHLFRFDETSGNTVFDLAGNGGDGTLQNGALRSASAAPVPSAAMTLFRSAVQFDTTAVHAVRKDTIWVGNIGGAPLSVDSATFTASQFSLHPASFSVPSDDSMAVVVHFTPDTVGDHAAVLTFSTNSILAVPTVSVLGTAVVPDTVPLPVELNGFSVESERLTAHLRWTTATEVNNRGFEVERRAVGAAWTKVTFISGHGTTNAPNEYRYSDKGLTAGEYSYRLRQVDNDGRSGYSKEMTVKVGSAPLVFALAQNYPNPFNPSTTIEFTVAVTEQTTVKVYDMVGREVATLYNDRAAAGEYHRVTFDASRLASGVYLARLVSGNKTQVKKMVLMK